MVSEFLSLLGVYQSLIRTTIMFMVVALSAQTSPSILSTKNEAKNQQFIQW